MLFAHVIDLDLGKLAQLERILQHFAWHIRMHMHFDQLRIAHNHQAVANRQQFIAQMLNALFCYARCVRDEKLGAVAKFDFRRADILHGRSRNLLWQGKIQHFCHFLAIHGHLKAFVDDKQASAARIDNPCLLEHRQQLRRFLKHLLAGANDSLDQIQQICPRVRLLSGLLRHAFGDC